MKFTYYTIIGRDPKLLKGHINNVKMYAGFDKLECEKEFIVIIYKNNRISSSITEELITICKDNNISSHIYNEPDDVFLSNLYFCWNLGYKKSTNGFVFRGGSDQVFSKDSFVHLYNIAIKFKDEDIILQANTIENSKRNLESRHILADLGSSFKDFNYKNFETKCLEINKNVTKDILTIDESVLIWGHPTPFISSIGRINRTDGVSWLMKRMDWEKYGPLPTKENGVTGDVIIHDRLQLDGYKSYIVKDCITYHFVRGESIQMYK